MQLQEADKVEIEALQSIIKDVFNVNIMKTTRKRELVDARIIYSKILRERGYTLKTIGVSLGKDHSTILHYMSMVDFILKQDDRLLERYMQCRDEFLKDRQPIIKNATEKELMDRINSLNKRLDDLLLERNNILNLEIKNRRLESIIDLINARTPQGTERIIEKKINQMFNDI